MGDDLEQLRRSLEQDLGLLPTVTAQVLPASDDGVSLIITRKQRVTLREQGFSDEDIRNMTPVQAHQHLGINRSEPSKD